MELASWEPFDELDRFQSRINALFNKTFGGLRMASNTATGLYYPAVDILESEDSYLIRADLPGMKKEDVHLEVQEGVLTLRGERRVEEPANGVEYHRVERRAGTFSRSFYLPQTIKQDGIKATFRDGILDVHMPKADEAKPKQIAIRVN